MEETLSRNVGDVPDFTALIQEDSLHSHSRENLKRHILVYCVLYLFCNSV
jgi:hypothetical protein